jgi:hypothetical protein
MKPLHIALATTALAVVSIVACTKHEPGSSSAQTAAVTAPTAVIGAGDSMRTAPGGETNRGAVNFPPRDEPFRFRSQDLESKYRDGLRRNPISSFVNVEGTIVWTQEYLRYRVSNCSHTDALSKVFNQIRGGGIAPECGGNVPFPPRNEPLDFRQQLEVVYRDQLRSGQSSTFVDPEGDIVWTQEYLRYRLSGCGHEDSVQKVLRQIDGGGIASDCFVATTTTTVRTTTTTVPGTTTSTTSTTIPGTPPTTTTSTTSTTSTTTTSVPVAPTATFSFTPNPCLISGSGATEDCTFNASGSNAGSGTITAYIWNYLGNSVQTSGPTLVPTFGGCGLGSSQVVNVPVTLQVRNSANLTSAPFNLSVPVRKVNACGFGQ